MLKHVTKHIHSREVYSCISNNAKPPYSGYVHERVNSCIDGYNTYSLYVVYIYYNYYMQG